MLKVLPEAHPLLGLWRTLAPRADWPWKVLGLKPLPGAVDTAGDDLTSLWSILQLHRNTAINPKRSIPLFKILVFSFVKDVLGTVETFWRSDLRSEAQHGVKVGRRRRWVRQAKKAILVHLMSLKQPPPTALVWNIRTKSLQSDKVLLIVDILLLKRPNPNSCVLALFTLFTLLLHNFCDPVVISSINSQCLVYHI